MEVVDFHGRRYYSELSREKLEEVMDEKERIFFPFSNRGLRTSQIVDYWPADPEIVQQEWEIQNLTVSQRRIYEASAKLFMKTFEGTKPLTIERIKDFVKLAKEGKTASFWR